MFMEEYLKKINLCDDIDESAIKEILHAFDNNQDHKIDKEEMFELISILLAKKDEMKSICQNLH